ncbi:MAG TPA: hypothetical protein VN397_01905 [Candidatus Methylomirabilis sp.]|nr:hypothetical protein [Candidatus Methylomirabilis sp.]
MTREFAKRFVRCVIAFCTVTLLQIVAFAPGEEPWMRVSLAVYSLIVILIVNERMVDAGWYHEPSERRAPADIQFIGIEEP